MANGASTMTRKDYVLLAAALASAKPAPHMHGPDHGLAAREQHKRDCEAIADALAENPRFDRERFLKACGIEE